MDEATDPLAGMVFAHAVHWYRVRRDPRAVHARDAFFYCSCLAFTLTGWVIEAAWKDAHRERGYALARLAYHLFLDCNGHNRALHTRPVALVAAFLMVHGNACRSF